MHNETKGHSFLGTDNLAWLTGNRTEFGSGIKYTCMLEREGGWRQREREINRHTEREGEIGRKDRGGKEKNIKMRLTLRCLTQ